ncbi:MAG: helix-hairpin-helix domain-containing protein [Candidatus Omnitrophota bacterium]
MFNLTKQEQRVALFVFSIALAGLGTDYFLKITRQPQLLSCFDKNLGKLELNEADASGLMKLPGIGETLAKRIIEYRMQNAGFRETGELRKIKGVTASRFDKLKNLVFVRDW